jgi:putative flippase GtrA
VTAIDVEREVGKIETKYPVVKTFRFAIAGVIGFGVTEVVLAVGLLIRYGKLGVPQASFSSLELLGMDVVALVIGVTASFLINEKITVRVPRVGASGLKDKLRRFVKFQAVSGIGNTGIVVVQLSLLTVLALSPILGSVVGAVVTYPIVYFISIKYVWKGHQVR